jgi:O-succinylbenzoic acid--CoA ligase
MSQRPPIRYRALYGDRLVPCYGDCPENLDRMLVRIAAGQGARPAVSEGGRETSYAELVAQAGAIAAGLAERGVAAGDRVALFAGNGAGFIAALLGIWRLGAIAVPIGNRQTADELTYMLGQCGAAAVIFDRGLADRLPLPGATPSVRLYVVIDDGTGAADAALPEGAVGLDALAAGQMPLTAPPPTGPQDVACIMYTSGTTGRPKGAMLSHLGFYHTARNYEFQFGYTAEDRMLLVIPATHISGLLATVLVTLQTGGCIVCRRSFSARDVLATIAEERISAAVMVPAMYNLLLLEPDIAAHDLSSWRIGHFGGAAMAEVTIRKLAEAMPELRLYNGFGSTETLSAVTLTGRLGPDDPLESVGKLLPCIDIRVLDAEGQEVQAGEAGELWIRGPGNAIGYWNNPEATRAAFVGGYWRSGDIGSVDGAGYLRVFDRIKDMINRGGYKVFCVELENVIHEFPGVIEVASVASPCPVLGERVHVFVHAQRPLDISSLRDFCRERLADYKVPDFVTFCAEPLPRNLNGKLSKEPLKAAAREAAVQRGAYKRPEKGV